MAELDYAFLADFAQVTSNGTLTTVGASYTFVETETLPVVHRMSIAGRIRARVTDPPIPLEFRLEGPEETPKISANTLLMPSSGGRPYDLDKIGHLFSVDLGFPIMRAGMHWVTILIDGKVVRQLGFEVLHSAPERPQ